MRRVTVLYEDRAARSAARFGLHELVQRCVADRLELPLWELSCLEGNPRGGNAIVRSDCQKGLVGRAGRPVVAVYDGDKIRELVKLPFSACKPLVKATLTDESAIKPQLTVVLLDRNIETILEVICACEPTIVPVEQQHLAIERKKHNERDLILRRTANEARRSLREIVLERVPSLAYLVGKVVIALSSP